MIPGVVNSQITYTPSWKTILTGQTLAVAPSYSTVVNKTISNVPAGASIRISTNVYLGGGSWDYNVVVSTSTTGGNYTDYDYMDEPMEVFVYGNISWQRTSNTNIQFLYFTDYSNIPNYWNAKFTKVEAYY